jgi:hypothetical protein
MYFTMKNRFYWALFIAINFVTYSALSQNKPTKTPKPTYVLNGVVKDEAGEPVVGATVRIEDINKAHRQCPSRCDIGTRS